MSTTKSAPRGTTALMTTMVLGSYHQSIVTMMDGLNIQTEADQAIAHRFVEFAGLTFTPKHEREPVIESMTRLRKRLVMADKDGVAHTVSTLDKAIDKIKAQPDRMPAAANGHAAPAHGGVAHNHDKGMHALQAGAHT